MALSHRTIFAGADTEHRGPGKLRELPPTRHHAAEEKARTAEGVPTTRSHKAAVAMDLAYAMAEEQAQLKAVLTDLRRQKAVSAERPAGLQESGSQVSQGSQPVTDSGQSMQGTARQPGKRKQQHPAPNATPPVHGHAHVSALCQPVSAAATEFTDIPEEARGASISGRQPSGPNSNAGHGSHVTDGVHVPNEPTAAPVMYTTELTAHASGVSAPIHFTDGSEATAAAAWGVTVQEEVVTTITAEGSDPPSAAASEVLTSLHLAQTEAGQAFSQAKSDVPSQGDGAGIPATIVLTSADADAGANFLPPVASQEHLAARSTDLMSRVDEQVLAGVQLDPEQLNGQKLGDTISQLLGTYEELKLSVEQTGRVAAARLDADMEAMPEAVPETSRPLETTAQCYASLAQIRDRLADQASQDSEECADTAIVRAWLQANMPGLDLAPAVHADAAQDKVLEEALEIGEALEEQASALTGETIEAVLAEAMAHAEQCLRLIASAKETPDLKALEALEAAKQLHACLAATSGADVSPEETCVAAHEEVGHSKPSLGKRILAGVCQASAMLVVASLLFSAWNGLVEYQRSAHWPPPA